MYRFTKNIKKLALDEGFDKVGITSANQPSRSIFLSEWLQKKYHGEMSWMEKYQDKRRNIHQLFPDAQSIICVAQNYYTTPKHSSNNEIGKISRYAWGEDYHKIIKKKLKTLFNKITDLDATIRGRVCVDTAPIMEKIWAAKAGLGWQGKHTNLISRDYGSWLFLGEIIINKKLWYDQPVEDYCGTCNACIKACPTDAIVQPYVLDANKCLSYLTIEYWDKPIPAHLSSKMHNWIFGCDICQDVCPWNKFSQISDETKYFPRNKNDSPRMKDLANLNESDFKKKFKKSPLFRTGWKNFIRNVKTQLKTKNRG